MEICRIENIIMEIKKTIEGFNKIMDSAAKENNQWTERSEENIQNKEKWSKRIENSRK